MKTAVVWFRQDLRILDNPALSEACSKHDHIIALYILDKKTTPLGSAQSWWLHHSLIALSKSLKKKGLKLVLRQGNPLDIILELSQKHSVEGVYWNRCYEPLAIKRDKKIKSELGLQGIEVKSSNGSLLNEPWDIKNKSGDYFKVYTPFWKHCLQETTIPEEVDIPNMLHSVNVASDDLAEWHLLPNPYNWAGGFSDYWEPGESGAQKKLIEFIEHNLNGYNKGRDIPAEDATSRLSPHLHFGEISPWTIWRSIELTRADANCDLQSANRFISELGWREFSYYLLYHFPQLPQANFREEFDKFPWDNDDAVLRKWQQGKTGYPIIDAGMRELWHTGYMHNRVRMIVASFLTKDLFIDWRLGADWFLDTLVDADLANNSASWQWVAGCGSDAAPYFRIFNPILQSKKFDPLGSYIKQWIPELAKIDSQLVHEPWDVCPDYPKPLVDHNAVRKTALHYYQLIRK
jgi:deoxyribodipyrimidine photo-lyase